jgi:chromosome segregation ATPase
MVRRFHHLHALEMAQLPEALCRPMKTAAEYRQYAEECRTLARLLPEGEQRNQLLEMGRTWDSLAETRKALIRNHPELDTEKASIKAQSLSEQRVEMKATDLQERLAQLAPGDTLLISVAEIEQAFASYHSTREERYAAAARLAAWYRCRLTFCGLGGSQILVTRHND